MKTDYSNTSLLDIVFENRNKAYGAYVLRSHYNQSVAKAISVTVLAALIFIIGNWIITQFKPGTTARNNKQVVIAIKQVDIPKPQQKIIPPEQRKNDTKARQTLENRVKKVVAQAMVNVDSIPTVEALKINESGLTTHLETKGNELGIEGGKGAKNGLEETVPEIKVAAAAPVAIAEVMPSFPGGEKALMRFLSSETDYPAWEREMGVEGKASVKFVVNEDGTISQPTLIRNDSPGFGREALRVVSRLPRFNPGKQQGKAVKVFFVLPFQWKQMNE